MGERSTSDTLVVLQTYDNSAQAEIVKSVLESAGIFCTLHGDILSSIYPIGMFPTRLMVRECDKEEAEKLLSIEY